MLTLQITLDGSFALLSFLDFVVCLIIKFNMKFSDFLSCTQKFKLFTIQIKNQTKQEIPQMKNMPKKVVHGRFNKNVHSYKNLREKS